MKIAIIIPAFNESELIGKTLDSLVLQTYKPENLIVVDDNSTDNTAQIAQTYAEKYPWIKVIIKQSEAVHLPGSKVIQAFNYGLERLTTDYDIICKFDSDLIFPENYLEKVVKTFQKDPKIGMAGGFCYIEKNGNWEIESLTNKDHIRGALKAYRKSCFTQIGGLKPAMGWDTIDELLAQYHGWQIKTDESLHVKHLKPTGATYSAKAKYKQGEAFYRMRYGFLLTTIASAKLASKKGNLQFFKDYIKGYNLAKKSKLPFLVNAEEGDFIRKLRWQKIKEKLF
ncbi:MAG: glycosyltransferase family 2 protein [Leeuwenhoekiella sp.]